MRPLNILIACEESGRVRDAFLALGHNAVSCDLIPTAAPGPHYEGDVLDILDAGWDGMIAHPPCTHHVGSGARWFHEVPKRPKPGVFYGLARYKARQRDRMFVQRLWNAKIPFIALENPVGTLGDVIGSLTQIIQPWQFGHDAIKTTCLWLKNLPPLRETDRHEPPSDPVERRKWQECWNAAPGPERAKLRSRTYEGIAAAMAEQWGEHMVINLEKAA